MKDLERRAIAEAVQGVLRHDARNKVGAIRNAAFFLRRKAEKTDLWAEPRVADFFKLIDAQLKELEAVLGERTGPPEEPVSLPVTNVASAVRVALEAHPSKARVQLQLDEQLAAAIDSKALTLAVRCLVDNALEAAGAEGKVVISAAANEGAPTIRVEDSGPGFSAARLAKAITPLQSTRPGAAGVGLAVAWRLVGVAGGDLTIENGIAGGAVAQLRLKSPA